MNVQDGDDDFQIYHHKKDYFGSDNDPGVDHVSR